VMMLRITIVLLLLLMLMIMVVVVAVMIMMLTYFCSIVFSSSFNRSISLLSSTFTSS
jgi:hypothetical protein